MGASNPSTHQVGSVVVLRRVVVVRKTTVLERAEDRPDRRLAEVMNHGGPLADRILEAHRQHISTVQAVIRTVHRKHMEVRVVAKLTRRDARWADLVVTVGGDGTFLRASHCISADDVSDGTPMLGVNSAVGSSMGFFCAADGDNFAIWIDAMIQGQVNSRGLWRMAVLINDEPVYDLALNDVLIAHKVPAETTRYTLEVDGRKQVHTSSGIWVATSAGSTGAIRSAGGDVLPLDDARLQYRIRELHSHGAEDAPMIGGMIQSRIEVVSHIPFGMLYVDGGHQKVQFGYGDRLLFQTARTAMPWIAGKEVDQRRQSVSLRSGRVLAAAGIHKPGLAN